MEPRGLDRADVERRVERLQELGLIDLDAPLREAIPALARNMARYRSAEQWWIVASGEDPHAVCECHF